MRELILESAETLKKPIEWKVSAVTLWIVSLCLVDSWLTLIILENELAVELNPFMAIFTDGSPGIFVAFKAAWTIMLSMLLVLRRDLMLFGKLKVLHVLYAIGMIYALVIIYEILMLKGMFYISI